MCHKIKTDIMSAMWLCYTVENRKKIIILLALLAYVIFYIITR